MRILNSARADTPPLRRAKTPGNAAFSIESISTAAGRPVEWRESIVRGDRYSITLTLSRTGPAAALPWRPPMRHAGISVGSDDASSAGTTA